MPNAETPAAGGEGLAEIDPRALAGTIAHMLDRYPTAALRCLGEREWQVVLAALRGPAPGDGSGEAMRDGRVPDGTEPSQVEPVPVSPAAAASVSRAARGRRCAMVDALQGVHIDMGQPWHWDLEQTKALADAALTVADAAIRAELPESLRDGSVIHAVRTLRMAQGSAHNRAYRWGKAALLLLPFVDMAAGEGIEWAEQEDGTPRMDAADLCVAFAEAMGCELGDGAYTAMMKEGTDHIRQLDAAPSDRSLKGRNTTGGSVHEGGVPEGQAPSQTPSTLGRMPEPDPIPAGRGAGGGRP